MSSSVILEVAGKGSYSLVKDDEFEDGIEALLTEEGRIAGIILFTILLIVLAVVMMLLRICLKPVSLGHVAVSSVQEQAGVDMVNPFPFDGFEVPAQEDDLWDSESQIGAGGSFGQQLSGSYREQLDTAPEYFP